MEKQSDVAPFVGVWIEIWKRLKSFQKQKSLPSWECGLKSRSEKYALAQDMSLPSWECGLKFAILVIIAFFENGRSLRGSVD